MAYYKAYIESMSGILENESTPEGQIAYSKACNNLLLFAPKSVIEAMYELRDEGKRGNQRHDELLSVLLGAIRQDLGISRSPKLPFIARLWASGVNPQLNVMASQDSADQKTRMS
jgi:hypothetical protein